MLEAGSRDSEGGQGAAHRENRVLVQISKDA
jgi:hypothetical protein